MRSMLFVPGDSERKLAKALSSNADALIIDLEDSVSAEKRPLARGLTAAFIANARAAGTEVKLYVRINPLSGEDWATDLAGVMPARPDGIVLPKPTSGEDVHRLSIAIGHGESQDVAPEARTRILPIVTETPISVLQMNSYVGASSRLAAMSWGAEDLSAVIGSVTNRDEKGRFTSPYRMVRDLCLITASAADAEPIDTVFVAFRDAAGLEREAREARRDGFTGKMAIHPDQVPVINAVFTPTADEIAHAKAVVGAFAGSAGVASLDGRMLDRPHLVLAEKLLRRAGMIEGAGR